MGAKHITAAALAVTNTAAAVTAITAAAHNVVPPQTAALAILTQAAATAATAAWAATNFKLPSWHQTRLAVTLTSAAAALALFTYVLATTHTPTHPALAATGVLCFALAYLAKPVEDKTRPPPNEFLQELKIALDPKYKNNQPRTLEKPPPHPIHR